MADEIKNHIVAKLKEAIQQVEGENHFPGKLANLSSKFQHLKKSLKPSSPESPNLTKLSREKLYNLINLFTEWQRQSKKSTPYFVDSLFLVYKFATNLDKILQAGSENEESTQPCSHQVGSGNSLEVYRWSDRLVDETKVHGLDDKVLSLQRLLVTRKNDYSNFTMIGVAGEKGIGKTTLCQVVFNRQEVRKNFLPRIWVCVSKQPEDDPDNKMEIVKRILESLGVEEEIIKTAKDRYGLRGLLYALRLQLKGKRYLIVLDDVWSTDTQYKDLCHFCSCLADDDEKCSEKLAYGLPKRSGGAVIVTSRNEELVMEMVGEGNLHPLLPLSDTESCWKIFKDSFGIDDERLDGLKKEIEKKCDGLPLAAKMMGQIAHEQLSKKPPVPEAEDPQEMQQQAN